MIIINKNTIFAVLVFLLTGLASLFPAEGKLFEFDKKRIEKTLEGWRKSWEERDLEKFMLFYSSDFDKIELEEGKRRIFDKAAVIKVEISELELFPVSNDMVVLFKQKYSSDTYSDWGLKFLHMREEGAEWKIVRERWYPLSTAAGIGDGGEEAAPVGSGESDFGEALEASGVTVLRAVDILEDEGGEMVVADLSGDVNFLLSTEDAGTGKLLKLTLYPVVNGMKKGVRHDSRFIGGISASTSVKDPSMLTIAFLLNYNNIYTLPPQKADNKIIIRLRKK